MRATGRRRRLAALVGLALAGGALTAMTLRDPHWADTGMVASATVTVTDRTLAPLTVDYRRLDARIGQLMQQPDIIGLAVGTIENGRVSFLKGYGETRAGSGDPVTPDTVFRWASLSKSVASALVVQLAGEGRLSLTTPVASLGTSLTVPGGIDKVTVADVLSHRVGLVHNAWDDRLEAGVDPRELRRLLGGLPRYCPPGTCYSYQNIAYDAASEIAERAGGDAYANLALTRLFLPLGMTGASIGRAGLEAAPSWAAPHHHRQPVAVEDAYYRVPAAGGVNSSIRDLTRWMAAQMGGAPAVLSPAMLDVMHRALVPTPPKGRRGPMDQALTDAHYGLGWRSYDYAGHHLVGHRGSVDGYGSLILFDPERQSGIVMLWNSGISRPARLQLEFFDQLYGLPATDWLELDSGKSPSAPTIASRGPAGPVVVAGAG